MILVCDTETLRINIKQSHAQLVSFSQTSPNPFNVVQNLPSGYKEV